MTIFGNAILLDQVEDVIENTLTIHPGREWLLSIIRRTDEIAGVADSSSLIQNMLDLMIEISQAESANFFQLDEKAEDLVITHVRSAVEIQHLVGLHFNRQGQGFPGISLSEIEVLDKGGLQSNMEWLRTASPEIAARIKNIINLPIATHGRTLGVVQIFNFQQAELDLLAVISGRLAIELERRSELELAQRSNQRLLTLMDMLREVAGTLDRNQLLHLVTENASRLVDSERSSLILVDPNTHEMVFQVAYQPQAQGLASTPTETITGASRYAGLGRKLRNNSNRSYFKEGEFSYFNRSAITVPLLSSLLAQDQDQNREQIIGGLMVLNKQGASFQDEDAQLMRILANQASTFLQVAEVYESTEELFLGVIKSLVTAIDAKDPYTQGHSQRVSDYSVLIARELGMDESLVNDIRIGSLLHDIGKIGIPDSILLKNGALTNEENELIREHPRTGANILAQVKLLDPMRPAILEHHERLDGSGYPAKLGEKQISWMGRIVAVADVFDAMTSDRPYRQAMSIKEVQEYLQEKVSILFDGRCVQALDNILARSN